MTTDSTDITAANRTFFDDLAKHGISPWQKQMSLQITNYIQQNIDFIGIPKHSGPTTLLDYACGTGTISRALGPSVTSIQALDLSSNMVERFNELAALSEIAPVRKARAIVGNLLTDQSPPELDGPELHNFDVIAIGAALHHFDDPAKAIGRLAQRLKVGGVLLIVDFVEEGDEGGEAGHGRLPTGAEHTIRKNGFNESEMREVMKDHGLGDFGWREMPERVEIKLNEGKPVFRKGFLARGVKLPV